MKWEIKIENFLGGYAPAYHQSTYPSYGNKNMAGGMRNVNLINPSCITQGLGLSTIGDEDSNVLTLIRSILDKAVSSDSTYAIGGEYVYPISSTAVSTPHEITGTSVVGEDIKEFRSNIYYTYNNSTAGNIGKYNLSTYDDDWGSTVPANATTLQKGVPHPIITSGRFFYVGNGYYVTSFDADTGADGTLIEQDLDLPHDEEISSLSLAGNTLYIASNNSGLSGSNKSIGSIYKWDRNSSSWNDDSIHGLGKVGGTFVKDGVVFVFHQDIGSSAYKLGYVNGGQVSDVTSFTGSLPEYYQITEYKNFIAWVSGEYIHLWGSTHPKIETLHFQPMDGGFTTVGGIAVPFGDLLVASNQTTSYKLAKSSGYETNSYWKSLFFDSSGGTMGKSLIDKVMVSFETLAAEARVDLTLNCDMGTSSSTKTISYDNDGAITQKIWSPNKEAKNFRLEFDWSEGNATNPVSIRSCLIQGHSL